MSDQIQPRESSLARLQTPDGVVVGAGFFYSPRHVICCASSVAAAIGIVGAPPRQAPEREIPVTVAGRPVQNAHILAWFTLEGDPAIDFAVLEFGSDLLSPGAQARLGIIDFSPGATIETLGYLPGVGSPIAATGRIVRQVSLQMVQVADASADGRLSMPGYNGAPVWDAASGAAVAILTVREDDLGDLVPILIPMEALARAFSGLPVRLPDEQPGMLVDVPELPRHYYDRPDDYSRLRAAVLSGRVLPRPTRGTTSVTVPSVRSDTGPTETLRSERIILQGMPGIGKSVLAAALARDQLVRRLFPDGIFWVHLGPTPDLPLLQARIATALGEGYGAFRDASQGRRVLRGLLYARSCLIILDDVWERAHARAFDCMGRDGLLLITARDVGLAGELSARRVPLSQMAAHEGAELLRRWAGAPLDTPLEQLIPAAAACSYIPVVIKLFASLLPEQPELWRSMIVRLNTTDYAGLAAHLPTYSFPILLRAIRLAWNALPTDLRTRWSDLAVFPFSLPITIEALNTYWRPLGLDPTEVQEVLSILAQRALIDVQRDAAGLITTIALHGLQANYLRWVASDLPALHRRLVTAYGALPPVHDGYILHHLVEHLRMAGMVDELCQVLFDFRYLQCRLTVSGLDALLSDYRICLDSDLGLGWEIESGESRTRSAAETPSLSAWQGGPVSTSLALVLETLRQAAPRLGTRAVALAAQLLARLDYSLASDVQALRDVVEKVLQESRSRPPHLDSQFIDQTLARLRRFVGKDLECKLDQAKAVDLRRVAAAFEMPDSAAVKCLVRLEVHTSPELQRLLAGARACSAEAWLRPLVPALAPARRREIATLFSPNATRQARIALSGRRAVSAGEDGTISIWDLESAALIQRLEAHDGAVSALAFTPDGQRFLSGGYDGRILIWGLQNGEWQASLVGHVGRVLSLAVSPDNRRAVSGSADGRAFIWDLEKSELLRQVDLAGPIHALLILPGSLQAISAGLDLRVWDLETGFIVVTKTDHTAPITAISFSIGGRQLLSAAEDGTLRLWDIGTLRLLRTIRTGECALTDAAFIPGTDFVISSSACGQLAIWDADTGQFVRALGEDSGRIHSLSVSPGGHACLTVHPDQGLRLWDLRNHRHLRTLKGHSKAVRVVRLFSDGRRAVSAGDDGSVRIWNVGSGVQIQRFDIPGQEIWAVAVTPNGRHVLAGLESGQFAVWDLGASDSAIGAAPAIYDAHAAAILAMDISPDGLRLVTASADADLFAWSFEFQADGLMTGISELALLRGHTSAVRGVRFFPDGWRVVSVSADRTIRVWNVEDGVALYSITGHEDEIKGVDILGDLPRFVTAGSDQVLRVWDAVTGRPLYVLNGHTSAVTGVASCDGGRRIVSVAEDRTLRVWSLPRVLKSPPGAVADLTGMAVNQSMVLSGHTDWINGVAVRADGTRAITASSDFHLHAWDISADGSLCLENLPEKPPAHPGGLAAVAFAPDGRMAASAGAQGLLMIWNLGHSKEESWQSEGYTMLPGVAPGLHSLTFLAGGRLLAGAGADRRIYVWDLESGGVTWRVLGEHHGNVVGLAPIPGINWLACAGDEGSIGICDLVSGSFLRWLQAGNSPICAMRMLDDGKHLMSFSANGMLRTWNIHSGELSHHAKLVAADSSPVDLLDCALSSSLAYAAGRRTGRNEVMVWSLDGEQFRSASEAVFEVPAGRNLALPGAVGPVAFLPGRPWILVASAARLMAWDILHLTPHVLFEGSSEFISLAVQPSGGLVAAADRAGNCHLMALKGYSS